MTLFLSVFAGNRHRFAPPALVGEPHHRPRLVLRSFPHGQPAVPRADVAGECAPCHHMGRF